MKAIVCLCMMAAHAMAAPPLVVRMTPQTLAKLQQINPMTRLAQPAANESTRSHPLQSDSLLKQSTLLHHGSNWTLVPKGAVVYVPAALKSRISTTPAGTLLPWADFLAHNFNWITTYEVTPEQAAGATPLRPEQTANWSKQAKVVVAVHQNGPISFHQPKPPANPPPP